MSEKKIAVFPGSFDPFTIGHESIVRRSLALFDEIIIAIGANAIKKRFFTLENRKRMISDVFSGNDRVTVDHYEGLTVDYCRKTGARFLLRGIRTAADFEYERAIAQMNKTMYPEIESVMLLTAPEHTPINSTIVRDIIRNGGDASKFLPAGIDIKKYM
ncbi:MAG TPA: pantetheine-phosphate adenylyltransferase [Bacteroidales bacterium]|nr:pantetheine-phosphate adenylyltransferase [Bacteroidales bacterium]